MTVNPSDPFIKAVDQPNAMRCADGSLVFPDDTEDALAFQHYHAATWVNGEPDWFAPYRRSDGEQRTD